jgi:hypothetical protein
MARILVARRHRCMALDSSASRSSLWDAPSEAATAKHEAEVNLMLSEFVSVTDVSLKIIRI